VAFFDNFGRFELWSGGRSSVRRVRALGKGQKEQLRAFIAAVKNGTPMPISLASLAATTAATLASQRGDVGGIPIEVGPYERFPRNTMVDIAQAAAK